MFTSKGAHLRRQNANHLENQGLSKVFVWYLNQSFFIGCLNLCIPDSVMSK